MVYNVFMKEDKKYKIIIVDDDDFLVDMYAGKFGNSGVEVLICKSGGELIEKLNEGEKADLVLLDIVLPEMNGLETLEQIRNANLAQDIAFVMLTNQSEESDTKRADDLGVAGYIIKASATPSEVVEKSLEIIKNFKKKS